MQGIGILMAAGVTAIVTSIFDAAFPSTMFPIGVPGCNSFVYQDSAKTIFCPLPNQTYYWNQIQASCPIQADYVCKYFSVVIFHLVFLKICIYIAKGALF